MPACGVSSKRSEIAPGMERAPLGIVIVSKILFLSEGLAQALGRTPLLSILGLSADIGEVLRSNDKLERAVMLLDAAFPNGVSTIRHVKAIRPDLRVVVFAVTETEENVIAWAEAGATGYIPTTAALSDLVGLLIDIMNGEQVCSSRVASSLIRRIASGADTSAGLRGVPATAPPLTLREREFVHLISVGLSNKEIARKLKIELSTTKSHVHNLLGKLNLQRRGQVASWRHRNEHQSI